ncbi:MAG: hypothetical protein KC483_11440 [Nitrosarchaeum sp.]|nr:hypothetical protein [Nitrosarchaeum sp.]
MASNFLEADANLAEFRSFLSEVVKETTDLREFFGLIAKDHVKRQRQIFQLKGPGKYKDLSPKYKIRKAKINNGNIYPILNLGGALAKANLEPGSPGWIYRAAKLNFELGVDSDAVARQSGARYPYPIAHQEGRGNNPERRFIFLDDVKRKAWIDIIQRGLQNRYRQKGWDK